jgi:hypothetical protein
MTTEGGLSVVELVVAVALAIVVLGGVFETLRPANAASLREPEAADMQQRARVAAYALESALARAGAGPAVGVPDRASGPTLPMPAVLPYRLGPSSPDPPGTFKTDTMTIVSVPSTAAQTVLAGPIDWETGGVSISPVAGCPWQGAARDPSCGLHVGATVLVSRDTGSLDLFRVTAVSGSVLSLQHLRGAPAASYPPGSPLVEIEMTTWYLRSNAATGSSQLMRYNGVASDAPVVDNVSGLGFEYFGDSPAGPLPETGIAAAELADGPWVPDAVNVNRFDADLWRVRRIALHVRIQSALAALRGPAGALFSRGGTSRDSTRLAPDIEVRVDVAPRNLGANR